MDGLDTSFSSPRGAHGNAVIVRAGSRSLHPRWLVGAAPEFDLYVLAYAPTPAAPAATYVEEVNLPGGKVAGWHKFLTARPEIFERYERIALIDNDVDCGAREINLAFRRGREHGLWLWQPSLTPDSYFSHAVTINNPIFSLRFVNFIEMMCPFFNSAYLKECSALFGLGYETGIDRFWCRLRKDSSYRFAVIDEVAVEHTEPVGAQAQLQGFAGGTDCYRTVIDAMQSRYNIFFNGAVSYGGVVKPNRRVRGRLAMTVLSCAVLKHYRATRTRGWFRKTAFDHIRHNLTRPIATDDLATRNVVNTIASRQVRDETP